MTVDMAEALVESATAVQQRYGLDVAEDYLAFPEALPATLEALRSGMPPEWFSHLIVDADEEVVVGIGGFTGPPSDGAVEIGYSVAPAHRRRGHATNAVRWWLDHAARHGVTVVRAHTLAEENASTAVLEKLGFRRVAVLEDPEVGSTWRWERSPAANAVPGSDQSG